MSESTIFVPGSIGNVGPGFDVLGLAVAEIGDTITVRLTDQAGVTVTGRDAAEVPTSPEENCAVIAARAMLKSIQCAREPHVTIERSLPLAGGLGASAASSVGGAYAACLAAGANVDTRLILQAALAGEAAVAGAHLDNIAPSLFGGLCICFGVEPPLVKRIQPAKRWWLTLLTPSVRMKTKEARNVLPEASLQAEWTQQMGYTSALVAAFATGDEALARQCLRDPYAEPRRKGSIPHFDAVKANALEAGAMGCSISGAGPTIFALSPDEETAAACADAMSQPFAHGEYSIVVSAIADKGALDE